MRALPAAWFCLLGLVAGCGPAPAPAPAPTEEPLSEEMPPTYNGPTRDRLTPGEKLPPLNCVGWFNGQPVPFGPKGPVIHIVDLWSSWCPECQTFAPALLELHRNYANRGVQFISVTDMPAGTANRFLKSTTISWPCGYGLAAQDVVALGCVNGGMANMLKGYLVRPTIYVVAADGTVIGSDESGRWKHRSRQQIVSGLEKLIEEGLANGSTK